MAFDDINAQAPVHFLVLPRKAIATLDDATDADEKVRQLGVDHMFMLSL